MSRVSFIFRTDTHVAGHSPASWKADYPSEIWSNLEQIGQIAKAHDVNAVLDGGDFFHVKAGSKNPHSLVERAARIHAAYPCPTFCVEGNHDMAHNNLETIPNQPLGVLYAAGVFGQLREQVFKDGNVQVRVVGVPYSPKRTLEDLHRIQKQPGDTHLITLVHALAGLNPPASVEDFFNEPVFRYESLVRRNGPDVVCFGHWHRDQGVEELEGRFFVNHGAVSRGALIKENLQRTPKVSVIEIDNGVVSVKEIPLQVAPAEDVFDLEKKAAAEREHDNIDQFVMKLLADSTFDPTQSVEANIHAMDFAHEVKSEALRFLELARAVG
jgi:exonuclease SbcD